MAICAQCLAMPFAAVLLCVATTHNANYVARSPDYCRQDAPGNQLFARHDRMLCHRSVRCSTVSPATHADPFNLAPCPYAHAATSTTASKSTNIPACRPASPMVEAWSALRCTQL